MTADRPLYGALSLLDHQMVDRTGRDCGKVDDLELDFTDDGNLELTYLLAGPGILAERLGRHRLGPWLQQVTGAGDDIRIPAWRISHIDSRVRLAADSDELATHRTEQWARERVIAHIPGNGIDTDQDSADDAPE
jgi:sporulation protein YlmC with PRC-barrel domain